MRAMEIARTGLDVEWRRLEIVAANLANANTVAGADGSGYRPLQLVTGPRGGFFRTHLRNGTDDARDPQGVAVYGVEAMEVAPRTVHEPSNPRADAHGDVSYPGVDHAQQMVLMARTARAYEANLAALSAARQMYAKALELGGSR